MPRIYFGHPVNVYNTELEALLLQKIAEFFLRWEIENPNQAHHGQNYKHWEETRGNGMQYYFQEVLPRCAAGVFLPFRDGRWGAGVFGEARFLHLLGRKIWQITPGGVISRVDDLERIPALTVDETKLLIRTPSGETRPY